MKRYLLNLAIAVDQGWNAFLGGHPDETISSRVGKAALRGGWFALACERLIDWLFLNLAGEREHCANSIEWDEGVGMRDDGRGGRL